MGQSVDAAAGVHGGTWRWRALPCDWVGLSHHSWV